MNPVTVTQDLSIISLVLHASLLAQAVTKSDHHYLTISDTDTAVELQRIPVRIDLAIENDFDF